MIPGSLEVERVALPTSPQTTARHVLPDLLHILSVWRARVTHRHSLSMLSDHILSDIGMIRTNVDREARKRFWRA